MTVTVETLYVMCVKVKLNTRAHTITPGLHNQEREIFLVRKTIKIHLRTYEHTDISYMEHNILTFIVVGYSRMYPRT